MKYLLSIFAIISLFVIQACDPLEDPCDFILCANGGICIEGACDCPDGFSGPNCSNNLCDNVVCQNEGTCINGTCDCPAGFTGANCQTSIDPCGSLNCENGGTCVNGTCNCMDGFTGLNCETMVDPCNAVSCENGGTCVNGLCDCLDGYTGVNCEQIDPCIDILCQNAGFCAYGSCVCPPVYAGEFCEIYTPDLFQGFWDGEDNCDSQTIQYVTTLSNDQVDDTIFEVGEFGEFGSSRKFTARINGFQITIERVEVENNVFLEATGTISEDGEQLEWTYTVEKDGVIENCMGVWKAI